MLSAVPADDAVLRTRVRNLAKIHARRKRDKEEANVSSQHMETNEFSVAAKPKTLVLFQ